jgi:hypothetical protein
MLSKTEIDKFGIIYTPNNLVDDILDLIPIKYFKDLKLKWMDLGAGNGAFTINLFDRLFKNIPISNEAERKYHILKNMIFMIEVYPAHVEYLKSYFDEHEINLITNDFLILDETIKFDIIVGNPPYNIDGAIKTPTNKVLSKKNDGKAIYVDFVKKALRMLNKDGFLNLIIPNIWLKPDKAGLYNLLTSHKIHKLRCLSTNETFKLFKYKAQTPTVYFLIQNSPSAFFFQIYDKITNNWINYRLQPTNAIPCNGITIINKLTPFISKYGGLSPYKTNTPKPNEWVDNDVGSTFKYKNIKTCILDSLTPKIIWNYSSEACMYDGVTKLVLANKMYGFPYLDLEGAYGLSSRDTYVFLEGEMYTISDLKKLQQFLSTKFAIFIFSVCNYRMRYLERYAFEFLPNITKIDDFPKVIDDASIAEFFNLDEIEKLYINNYSRNYTFFKL